MKKVENGGYFMEKRLIFGVLGALLALGAVAHRFFRNDESVIIAHSEPRRVVQPKLTKFQKIQKLYQAEADPVGVIPVSFEQMKYDEIPVAPKVQQSSSVSLASTSAQAESAVVPKALMSSLALPESHVRQNGPEYADTVVQQPVYYDQCPQQEVQNPHIPMQSANGLSDAPQSSNVVTVDQQAPYCDDAGQPHHYFNRSRHINAYQPYQASTLDVKKPTKQPVIDTAQLGEENSEPAISKSLFGRMKNMVSKVPKWLYGLGLAGLYPFLKSKKAVDLPAVAAVDSEKQDVDVAGQVNDKLHEKMDEYTQQHSQSPDGNDPMGALPVQEFVGQQEASVTMDNIEAKIQAPVSGGLFGATKRLLSPARSIDATYVPENVPVASVEHAPVVAQQPGMVCSAINNAYQYFAKRLQSTAGILSLATKATALGLQGGMVAHGLHQARSEALADAALDQAVMAVAQKCHVGMKQLAVANPVVQPIDGPSYAAQIGAGNVGAVAQQLAAKCAMLRLR